MRQRGGFAKLTTWELRDQEKLAILRRLDGLAILERIALIYQWWGKEDLVSEIWDDVTFRSRTAPHEAEASLFCGNGPLGAEDRMVLRISLAGRDCFRSWFLEANGAYLPLATPSRPSVIIVSGQARGYLNNVVFSTASRPAVYRRSLRRPNAAGDWTEVTVERFEENS